MASLNQRCSQAQTHFKHPWLYSCKQEPIISLIKNLGKSYNWRKYHLFANKWFSYTYKLGFRKKQSLLHSNDYHKKKKLPIRQENHINNCKEVSNSSFSKQAHKPLIVSIISWCQLPGDVDSSSISWVADLNCINNLIMLLKLLMVLN